MYARIAAPRISVVGTLFMEGRGRGTDMRYVYSPLRGLVDVQGNE
jgi:hypothetical protein